MNTKIIAEPFQHLILWREKMCWSINLLLLNSSANQSTNTSAKQSINQSINNNDDDRYMSIVLNGSTFVQVLMRRGHACKVESYNPPCHQLLKEQQNNNNNRNPKSITNKEQCAATVLANVHLLHACTLAANRVVERTEEVNDLEQRGKEGVRNRRERHERLIYQGTEHTPVEFSMSHCEPLKYRVAHGCTAPTHQTPARLPAPTPS